ncbi:MAG: SpoIID/LytB domain-containing protein [Kosmotogaceae bacterium]
MENRFFVVFVIFVFLFSGVIIAQDNEEEILYKAYELYKSGDYEKSKELYLSLIDGFTVKSLKNLATVYEEQGEYRNSVVLYETLFLITETPEHLLNAGIAYFNLGLDKWAMEKLKMVLDNEEDSFAVMRDAAYYLGELAYKKGFYLEARNYYEKCIEFDEHYAPGYKKLGDAFFNLEEYKLAIEEYKIALSKNNAFLDVEKAMSKAFLEMGEIEEAIRYAKKAFSDNPSDGELNLMLENFKKEYPEKFVVVKREFEKPPVDPDVTFLDIWPLSEQGQEMRIGIMTDQDEITLQVSSMFSLTIENEVLYIGEKTELITISSADGTYTVGVGEKSFEPDGPVTISPLSYEPIYVHNVEYATNYYEDRQYRGEMEIIMRNEKLTLVNLVGLEEYLLSVVPAEMPAYWPLNALKAQSVAARSYVLANKERHSKDGFNLCATNHCTVYKGISSEHDRSTIAVKETAGEILTYNDKPIVAVYTTNSGGFTENSNEIWGTEVPYLKSVTTEIKSTVFPESPLALKDWLQEQPESFSANERFTSMNSYRWQVLVPVEIIEERYGIDNITKLYPKERSSAGSVVELYVETDDGSKTTVKASRYRLGSIKSNRFWIRPHYEEGNLKGFMFYGSGWGHGIGMDQVAAAAMASNGKLYWEILKHFYTGTKLVEVD